MACFGFMQQHQLKLPPAGLTEVEARELHMALLDKVLGGDRSW
jgi:hypothetical protein